MIYGTYIVYTDRLCSIINSIVKIRHYSLTITYEAVPNHNFASSMIGYIDEIDVTLHLNHKELLSELILCKHDTNAATLTSGLTH